MFTPAPAEPATAALAASNQREDAGAIATGDVALARELRVGRPERSGRVDDGGLVDVNHVPAQVLVERLGLSAAQAGQVIEARERLGGFAGAEDLVAGSGLPAATVDALRERLRFGAVERATDPHDERPDTPGSEDGQGMPAGWYPDPQGGPGRRWWDGAHWADQVTVPTAQQGCLRAAVWVAVVVVVVPVVLYAGGVAVVSVMGQFKVGGLKKTLDAMALPPEIRWVSEEHYGTVLCLDDCLSLYRSYSSPLSREQTYRILTAELERLGYRCTKWCDFDESEDGRLYDWQGSANQPRIQLMVVSTAYAERTGFLGRSLDATRPVHARIEIH